MYISSRKHSVIVERWIVLGPQFREKRKKKKEKKEHRDHVDSIKNLSYTDEFFTLQCAVSITLI